MDIERRDLGDFGPKATYDTSRLGMTDQTRLSSGASGSHNPSEQLTGPVITFRFLREDSAASCKAESANHIDKCL